MESKTYSMTEIKWAQRKILGSWIVTGGATILFLLSFLAETLEKESIFKIVPFLVVGAPFMGYAIWSAYWVFLGAFWPFVRRHWKGLLVFSAINLPAIGLIGILIMIVLLPIAIILLVMSAVIGSAVAVLGSLVIVCYGIFGGGVYHYLQTRAIARSDIAGLAFVTSTALSSTPSPLPASPWFGLVDGKEIGPYSYEELQAEVGKRWSAGANEVLVAQAGDEGWRNFPNSLTS